MGYLEGLKNLKSAPINDIEGDCLVNLILLAPEKEVAKRMIKESSFAGGIYDQSVRDWHIYTYWEHILEKKTPTKEGCPYTCPYYKGTIQYSQDMCPRTLDILSRVVVVPVSERWKESEIKEVAEEIKKYD